MQIAIEKSEKKRIDKSGNPITDSAVLAEIERIEQKQANREYVTAKEKINLAKLLKYGDNATAKNKLVKVEKKKPAERRLNLASNKELTIQEIDSVIGDIFQGISPAESLAKHNISPRTFYTYLKSPSINKSYYDYITEEQKKEYNIKDVNYSDSSSALLEVFSQAREIYAESCFGQLTELNKELKAGQIDSSSYNAITYNLRWIMSKLFPAQYAEKIAVAQDVKIQSKQELNIDKVKELASLID
jgi:hypothetical protein